MKLSFSARATPTTTMPTSFCITKSCASIVGVKTILSMVRSCRATAVTVWLPLQHNKALLGFAPGPQKILY